MSPQECVHAMLARFQRFADSVLEQPEKPLSYVEYMELYTTVYNISTRPSPHEAVPGGAAAQRVSPLSLSQRADLHGHFYQQLRDSLQRHCKGVLAELAPLVPQELPRQYTSQQTQYNKSKQLLSRICSTFEQRRIRRELHEKRGDVFLIAELAERTWHREVFEPLASALAAADPAEHAPQQRQLVQETKAVAQQQGRSTETQGAVQQEEHVEK